MNENILSENNYVNNETRIQENFSFDKNILPLEKKVIKYKLPSIDFLKIPPKKIKIYQKIKLMKKL